MKRLLVGTAPPPGGADALALARRARALVEAGDEVVILSGDLRSTAHRTARLEGLLLGANLVWYARRYPSVELRLEPSTLGAPGRHLPRRSLLALRLALGRYRDVRLRLDHPLDDRLLGRRARALLSCASELVVATEAERAALVAATGQAVVCEPAPEVPRRDDRLTEMLSSGRVAPPRRMLPLLVYERVRILGVLALRRLVRRGG